MKFLLVTYNDFDGVGQTVVNLNASINALGYSSKIVLLHKKKEANNTYKIDRSFFKRIFFYFYEFLKKKYSDLFSFGNSTINFNSLDKYLKDADVILFIVCISFFH